MCWRETFVLAEGILVELLVSVLGSSPASGLRVSPRQVGRCSAPVPPAAGVHGGGRGGPAGSSASASAEQFFPLLALLLFHTGGFEARLVLCLFYFLSQTAPA